MLSKVLDLCDVNFRQAEFSNAQKLMKCLVDVLWHVDGNHEHINNKFAEKQCKGLPSYFNPVHNHTYNDYKALKKAKPKLSSELLLQYSDSLFDILSVWTNVCLSPNKFMSAVKEIAESVRSYASYLVKCKNSMALLRSDSNPNKDRINTHFVMPNPIEPVAHVDIK